MTLQSDLHRIPVKLDHLCQRHEDALMLPFRVSRLDGARRLALLNALPYLRHELIPQRNLQQRGAVAIGRFGDDRVPSDRRQKQTPQIRANVDL